MHTILDTELSELLERLRALFFPRRSDLGLPETTFRSRHPLGFRPLGGGR